jgi:enoyl-[acyl-carrier-protein] reductase (NADH)
MQIKNNNRYAGASNWTMQEVAEAIKANYGSIDILVQSLADEPEVWSYGSKFLAVKSGKRCSMYLPI